MSSIPPTFPGAIPPLANAIAGQAAQRGVAETNQTQAEAAQRKFTLDQQRAAQRSIGDVGESSQSGDRDADGRDAWHTVEDPVPTDDSASSSASSSGSDRRSHPSAPDPLGERGSLLDLEA
jgi:hypothetical protein